MMMRSYFGLRSHFKSQILSRKTKILINKTLVRPIFTYVVETWTMTKNDERRLRGRAVAEELQ
jgi:ribosome-associated toxin RatA of RatAB toxin-antitoxin module